MVSPGSTLAKALSVGELAIQHCVLPSLGCGGSICDTDATRLAASMALLTTGR